MTLEDIVSGYSNVLISLADSHGKTVYHSPGAPAVGVLNSSVQTLDGFIGVIRLTGH